MRIRYHAEAEKEVVRITEYYASLREGLGVEFRKELDAAVDRITGNPLQFSFVRRDIRCCLLHRFPYGVYYRLLDDDTIEVVVVKHHRRNPRLGIRRK